MRTSILVVFLSLIVSINVYAETNFDYPELVVTPSASDRIQMMAKAEAERAFYEPTAMQISALATLSASIMHMGEINTFKDPDETSGTIGLIVGGGWLAFNFLQFNKRSYYGNAYESLKKMPGKTKSDILARERIAEEYLRDRSRMMKRFAWLSVASNLAANLVMSESVNKKTTAETIEYVAAGLSILPLIFESEEESVYDTHKTYKKKIYAPIVQSKLFYDKTAQKFIPGINLSYVF